MSVETILGKIFFKCIRYKYILKIEKVLKISISNLFCFVNKCIIIFNIARFINNVHHPFIMFQVLEHLSRFVTPQRYKSLLYQKMF